MSKESLVSQDGERLEQTLRPFSLSEFVGQNKIKENLDVFIRASKLRNKSLDHVLLSGPPGLGKTTLAQIIAKEMDSELYSTSGPAIEKQGDLAAILTNLQDNSLLFIDEIHRLSKNIEEILYSAMEDFSLDIIIGQGPGARSMKISLPEFTLVGATTKSGLLSSPLRDRFGIPIRFEYYEREELRQIVLRSAGILQIQITDDASEELAKRSRGTPRIAIRLLKRANDFALTENNGILNASLVKNSLEKLEVDEFGLDLLDRRLIYELGKNYKGGPVGLSTLAILLSEDKETIEDVCEPYLIQSGLLMRTPKGRVLTDKGSEYFQSMDKNGI